MGAASNDSAMAILTTVNTIKVKCKGKALTVGKMGTRTMASGSRAVRMVTALGKI